MLVVIVVNVELKFRIRHFEIFINLSALTRLIFERTW